MTRPDDSDITPQVNGICFGLDRKTDEQALAVFLRRFTEPELLRALIPRLTDTEITATLDFLTGLMQNHLREGEYHRLFLND